MKHFYFARHGETEANLNKVMSGGGRDLCLTETGKSQAQALRELVHQHAFSRVFISSLLRARETAEILLLEKELPYEFLDELQEWHMGSWEGQTYQEVLTDFLGSGEPTGGESRQQFYARVEKGLQYALKSPEPFLIVAHGGVWMVVQDLLKIPRFKIGNCQLVRVDQANQGWTASVIAT